jgi:hypothetical protein
MPGQLAQPRQHHGRACCASPLLQPLLVHWQAAAAAVAVAVAAMAAAAAAWRGELL